MQIRSETPSDIPMIHEVVRAAFDSEEEANLVDWLRASGRLTVSFVAQDERGVVGHIAFSPVSIGDNPPRSGIGLAPLAVRPDAQRRGIGDALGRAGLEACAQLGYTWCVVLGDPAYYGRFGFAPASDKGFGNEYAATDAFMILELTTGGIPSGGGLIRYAPEFARLENPG